METLLVFFAIIAIQMIAAYSAKQKKEAAKKTPPPKPAAHHPPKKEPILDEVKVELRKQEPIIKEHPKEETPILNSQLDLKNPAQGILWNAILHEPRYRVKWKRR